MTGVQKFICLHIPFEENFILKNNQQYNYKGGGQKKNNKKGRIF